MLLKEAKALESDESSDWRSASTWLGKPFLQPLWQQLQKLCDQLAEVAEKQLEGRLLDERDQDFILGYGQRLANIMLYRGNSYNRPVDDAPSISEVGVRDGDRLQVGIGRPREIYVLYPTPEGQVLCRGAVLPYAEFISSEPVSDEEWRERVRSSPSSPTPEWLHGG